MTDGFNRLPREYSWFANTDKAYSRWSYGECQLPHTQKKEPLMRLWGVEPVLEPSL
jgi:hypothetical protein